MKHIYYALSTINYAQNGYQIIAKAHTKKEAKEKAEKTIETMEYASTLFSNLIIVSKTKSKKFNIPELLEVI